MPFTPSYALSLYFFGIIGKEKFTKEVLIPQKENCPWQNFFVFFFFITYYYCYFSSVTFFSHVCLGLEWLVFLVRIIFVSSSSGYKMKLATSVH